ncbi:sensor histidine kinase [Anaerosporobacter sp.]|uniref:sensor histidine kinase n=1 Tax=Anaerosporobacter sp. TaxID=1872529 RepID=UPI00286F6994|nr:HAMP domain-containing sensor histidine kinase [Anaerosporobacter sp.]
MCSDKTATKLRQLCKKNPEFDEAVKQLEFQHQFVISQITHEIRNPLTLINSTTQLIESRYPEIAENKLWEQLTDDISDLILLLEDVTTYNHSGKLNMEATNIYELLQKLVQSFQIHTADNDITIHLSTAEDTAIKLETYTCDSIKLRQAFTNIIKNAIEAIHDSGEVYINVQNEICNLDTTDSNTEYLTISFKNNGEPIDVSDQATIFKPFITHKPSGTGMGLAITEQIILAHGGFIQCSSDNAWTEFKIFLPLR